MENKENNRIKAIKPYTEDQIKYEGNILAYHPNLYSSNSQLNPLTNVNCDRPKFISGVSSKDKKWTIIDSQIGDPSTIGKVYTACLSETKDCDYIVKIMDIHKGSPTLDPQRGLVLSLTSVLNEIEIQMRISEIGIAPKIIDAFIVHII